MGDDSVYCLREHRHVPRSEVKVDASGYEVHVTAQPHYISTGKTVVTEPPPGHKVPGLPGALGKNPPSMDREREEDSGQP